MVFEFDMISNVIDCFIVSIWFLPYVEDFFPQFAISEYSATINCF